VRKLKLELEEVERAQRQRLMKEEKEQCLREEFKGARLENEKMD
jgi:hypothetical protein